MPSKGRIEFDLIPSYIHLVHWELDVETAESTGTLPLPDFLLGWCRLQVGSCTIGILMAHSWVACLPSRWEMVGSVRLGCCGWQMWRSRR